MGDSHCCDKPPIFEVYYLLNDEQLLIFPIPLFVLPLFVHYVNIFSTVQIISMVRTYDWRIL